MVCYRCGKDFGQLFASGSIQFIDVAYDGNGKPSFEPAGRKEFVLCEKCARQFRSWMEGKEEVIS